MSTPLPGVITNYAVAEEQMIFYRQHLDIFLEDAFPPFKLFRDQHIFVREIGNCVDCNVTCSRGFGKTHVTAMAAFGLGVLYPNSEIFVISATAKQATLALGKIKSLANTNTNIQNEILTTNARSYVQMSKDSAICRLKSGSVIKSITMDSARGEHGKIIIEDEALDVDQEKMDSIVTPIRNTTRPHCIDLGIKDYESKIITITSACPKTNLYYNTFIRNVKEMGLGNRRVFACALNYEAAAANGITSMEFFEEQKSKLPAAVFDMEYGSKFIGADSNSAFPYELTTPCRTLENIEMEQPKNSKSRYVISLDIATSQAKGSDNSILTVEKFTEKSDGSFAKKLVHIRSYNGKPLDYLAEEVRKYYHIRFPNSEKIIYDARGLGDSFDRFFDKEWIDPASGKEFPPLVVDDMPLTNPDALQVLHPFRAVNQLNQRIYTNLRVALEKHTIELPMSSRIIRDKQLQTEDESKRMSDQEYANFLEADALQIEMGNVVEKTSAAGNKTYDVPKATQHKDRYSSLAMANDYVCELEKESVRLHKRGPVCIGIVGGFDDASSRNIIKSFGGY